MPEKSEAAVWGHGGGGNIDAAGNHRHLHYTGSDSRTQDPAHGKLSGDVWTKSTRASVHQLRAPRAWCLDAGDLAAAERAGVRLVHIHDMEQLRHYWATLETIHRRGFPVNRGHGEQWALILADWSPTRGEAEEVTERETVKQVTLW